MCTERCWYNSIRMFQFRGIQLTTYGKRENQREENEGIRVKLAVLTLAKNGSYGILARKPYYDCL